MVQGIQTETTEDGILIVRINNVRRETIDSLYEVMHNFDIEGIALNRHNRSMIVISGDAYPTPYATHRVMALVNSTPKGLKESQAIVITNTIASRLVKMFINKLDMTAQQAARLFFSEQEGFNWLNERDQIIAAQNSQQIQS